MKKILIKLSIIISIFLSIQLNSYALTLDDLNIEIDKEILHPKEEVTISINFGRILSKFEINIAYDKNLFEYYSSDKDINLNDNGDIVTLTYPTLSTTTQISGINVTFKTKDNITASNPTDFKITLQNMQDGLTSDVIENPLLPIEKSVIVEPVYKDYKFYLEHDKSIIPNEENNMRLILKSEMGQNYSNTKIYARIVSEAEGEAQITATDTAGEKYSLLEEGWGGELGEPIGGANVIKELALVSKFSDPGNYQVTFELQDLNNSNFIVSTETFDITVGEIDNIQNQTNTTQNSVSNLTQSGSNSLTNNVQGISNTTTTNTTGEIQFKPTTLPKAGSTIYFLILPIGGILILIYCFFKKKDDEL